MSNEPYARALKSLQALALGDSFGEAHFPYRKPPQGGLEKRLLPGGQWNYTDDTAMAISLLRVLKQRHKVDQELLAQYFAESYAEEPHRGYGGGAISLLHKLCLGEPWQKLSQELFGGGGSYGNGAAMRVAPLGAYFSEHLDLCKGEAKRSAVVTHSHQEGIAGAIAIAIATALFISQPQLRGAAFLDKVAEYLPKGEVQSGILASKNLLEKPTEIVAALLGNGQKVSAQDTVPTCLWIAQNYQDNFVEALWQTASIGGDIDTNCAIVAGMLGNRASEQDFATMGWAQCEPLPDDLV